MRLVGVIGGAITREDRPHWTGEVFTISWQLPTPEPPSSPGAALWANVLPTGGAGWLNVSSPAGSSGIRWQRRYVRINVRGDLGAAVVIVPVVPGSAWSNVPGPSGATNPMRLLGVVEGAVTPTDRPQWMGEVFRLRSGDSLWLNVVPDALADWLNASDDPPSAWINPTESGAAVWLNVAGPARPTTPMRLVGVVGGAVAREDRPHWMGEVFTLQMDAGLWSNVESPIAVPTIKWGRRYRATGSQV